MKSKRFQPKQFHPPYRVEREYSDEINKLLGDTLNLADDATPPNVVQALLNLSSNPLVLSDIAARIAGRMVTQVRVANARNWREAARKASRGREIYAALQQEMQTQTGVRVNEIVAENAQLIRSIPGDLREMVNNELAAWSREGLRPETIAAKLRERLPQLTRNKAALIARTETSKASTAITRARSEDLGLHWYQWATSEDQRVRSSHRFMDKMLVNWSDAPSPEKLVGIRSKLGHYHAGNAPNCRCDCYPVISLDMIHWPARVYWAGTVRRFTRGQFAEMSGRRVA